MDWFLHDIDLRHERVKCYLLLKNTSSEFCSAFFCHSFHFIAFLIKQGFLLLLLLLLAGYITVKEKTHFCSRNEPETSYAEDHGNYIEMTIAETNVDVNLEISLLSDFPESASLEAKGFNRTMEEILLKKKFKKN